MSEYRVFFCLYNYNLIDCKIEISRVFSHLIDPRDLSFENKIGHRSSLHEGIDRFSFDAEILVLAKKLGYKIKEVPITWKNDPESKVKFKNMAKMGLDLMKIRMNLIKRIYV